MGWSLFVRDVLCTHFDDPGNISRLNQLHLVTACYLVLMFGVMLIIVKFLQGVLLPALLAAGMAVLFEPLVFLLVDPVVRLCTQRKHLPGLRATFVDGGVSIAMTTPLSHNTLRDAACTNFRRTAVIVRWLLVRLWCVVVVGIVILGALSMLGSLGVWVTESVKSVNWDRYLYGSRMALIRDMMAKQGFDNFEGALETAVTMLVREVGVQLLQHIVFILSSTLFLILFLAFLLVDSAYHRRAGKEPWRQRERRLIAQLMLATSSEDSNISDSAASLMAKIRIQMRAWITAKFYLSVLKAILIGGLFFWLGVELSVLWTMLTFVFNFMPLGSSVAVVAPMPFVILDPAQSYMAVAACVAWPLLVHNVVGNVVEPKLFASSLSLHPVTVLLALAFWTAMWGVMGALVCVPLTAIIRVIFLEFQAHPYVPKVLALIEGKLGDSSAA